MNIKLTLSLVGVLIPFCVQAAEHNPQFATGRDYYLQMEFKQAAARFQIPCNTNNDAEACYWAGLSYERLADIRFPYGCKIDAKAHMYFSKATELAPSVPQYRDALFNFLLSTDDCSRKALQEAAGILSAMSESDPDYALMRIRLEEQTRPGATVDRYLANIFRTIPRAIDNIATSAEATLKNRPAGCRVSSCTVALQTVLWGGQSWPQTPF